MEQRERKRRREMFFQQEKVFQFEATIFFSKSLSFKFFYSSIKIFRTSIRTESPKFELFFSGPGTDNYEFTLSSHARAVVKKLEKNVPPVRLMKKDFLTHTHECCNMIMIMGI